MEGDNEEWVSENGIEVDPLYYESWSYSLLRDKDTRWTPITQDILDLIDVAYEDCGENWAELCRQVGMSERHLRKIRNRDPQRATSMKCISFTVLDRIVARTGVGYLLHDLPWYTIEELQVLGHWKLQLWSPVAIGQRQAARDEEIRKMTEDYKDIWDRVAKALEDEAA